MRTNSSQQIIDLHTSLYHKAYASARQVAGVDSPALEEYSQNFYRMLPNSFSLSDEDELVNSMIEHRLTLYGDFHTLRQSQRGLLRVLRHMKRKCPDKKIILGVEMVMAEHQIFLNQYFNENLEENSFLERIDYEKNWGFPWKNYAPLLEFAKSNDIALFGINAKGKSSKNHNKIFDRDRRIASHIYKILTEFPQACVVALVGEFHLADEHLPFHLREINDAQLSLNICRIVNNVDKYFFELIRSSDHFLRNEYLSLGPSLYCVVNTPAWIKWRSLLSVDDIVTSESTFEDQSLEEYNDHSLDIEEHLIELMENLASFLAIDIDRSHISNLSVIRGWQESSSRELGDVLNLQNKKLRVFMERFEQWGFYFDVDRKVVYLKEFNLNVLVQLAGEILQSYVTSDCQREKFRSPGERFYTQLMRVAAGFVSARILNPKRKLINVGQLENLLLKTKRRRIFGESRQKREFAKFIIGHEQWILKKIREQDLHYHTPIKGLYAFDERIVYGLNYALGQVFGHIIYELYLASKLSMAQLQFLFSSASKNLETAWGYLIEVYQIHYGRSE